MRIDAHAPVTLGADVEAPTPTIKARTPAANAEAVRADLSYDSDSLGALNGAALAAPAVRPDRVQHFQQLIASGYQVDRQQLANSILACSGA